MRRPGLAPCAWSALLANATIDTAPMRTLRLRPCRASLDRYARESAAGTGTETPPTIPPTDQTSAWPKVPPPLRREPRTAKFPSAPAPIGRANVRRRRESTILPARFPAIPPIARRLDKAEGRSSRAPTADAGTRRGPSFLRATPFRTRYAPVRRSWRSDGNTWTRRAARQSRSAQPRRSATLFQASFRVLRRNVVQVDRLSDSLERFAIVQPRPRAIAGVTGFERSQADGDVTRGNFIRLQLSVRRQVARTERRVAEILDAHAIHMQLAQAASQAVEVLAPIEIGIHDYFFRMRSREFVEVRQVVGVRQRRGDDQPCGKNYRQPLGLSNRIELVGRVSRQHGQRYKDGQDVPHADVDLRTHADNENRERKQCGHAKLPRRGAKPNEHHSQSRQRQQHESDRRLHA